MLYAAGSGRGRAENSCSGFLPVSFVLACTLRYTRTCRGAHEAQKRAARNVQQAMRCGRRKRAGHTLYMRSTLMSMERATATAMSPRSRPTYSS